MFVDARTLPANFLVEADICIAGAGAAGITLARALAGGGHRIAVFESGGLEYNAETQSLYAGEVVQQAYMPLDRDRLRYLGGSTNHWQGSCRPFDALDLADWPFGLDVMEPFYRRAQEVCQLGPYTFEPKDWVSDDARPLELGDASPLKSGVFQYSPPTRFGTAYRDDLANGAGLTVYLNANLVQINVNEHGDGVTGYALACLDHKQFRARGRHYVLATGGIENVRLLLNSNQVQKAGLGNQNDLVGRYFMDHPFVPAAATIFAEAGSPQMRFYDHHVVQEHIIEGYVTASDEVRRGEKLFPFSLGIRVGGGDVDEGVGNVELPAFAKRLLSDSAQRQASFYLPRVLDRVEGPVKWIYQKMWRETPGVYVVAYDCGPEPDPESRVTLIDKVDALGLRETRLAWKLPADLERQMHRALELLGQELGRTGVGRLRIESAQATGYDPMRDLSNGSHHMGTTRMNADPRQGVVDADCRVHGIGNLFVAGSSVFPSYACDDPTMTIVALALRLADHLKSLPA
jgi:choline dehydrogenase-like flavoprotein